MINLLIVKWYVAAFITLFNFFLMLSSDKLMKFFVMNGLLASFDRFTLLILSVPLIWIWRIFIGRIIYRFVIIRRSWSIFALIWLVIFVLSSLSRMYSEGVLIVWKLWQRSGGLVILKVVFIHQMLVRSSLNLLIF